MLPERRMGRMPDALSAEDATLRFDLRPFGIKHVTLVAEPLRTELPGAARPALRAQIAYSRQSDSLIRIVRCQDFIFLSKSDGPS